MRELLRCNDAVVISFAQAVLQEFGIANILADQFISVAEGSIGAFPRRLLVDATDWSAARRALTDAGLDVWLMSDGETQA
jgi:Putative prokaryotic signal transducing protein